jgi:hypothetical protein
MIKKLVLASVLAASFAGIAAPALAAVYVQVAPPAPRVEVVPAPRHGYAWVGGHWEWRRHQHVWVGGNWIRERRGYHYVAPVWEQRDNGWRMNRGEWRRGDRDGDGVPNNRDRAPDNPNRS